jgi:hypothetical protein
MRSTPFPGIALLHDVGTGRLAWWPKWWALAIGIPVVFLLMVLLPGAFGAGLVYVVFCGEPALAWADADAFQRVVKLGFSGLLLGAGAIFLWGAAQTAWAVILGLSRDLPGHEIDRVEGYLRRGSRVLCGLDEIVALSLEVEPTHDADTPWWHWLRFEREDGSSYRYLCASESSDRSARTERFAAEVAGFLGVPLVKKPRPPIDLLSDL